MITKDEVEKLIKIINSVSIELCKAQSSKKFTISDKKDNSPLTSADLMANDIICNNLKKLFPQIPIISEENLSSSDIKLPLFWCIDPLDGTKEFISNSDEFSVNIALIENFKPIFGIVSIPKKQEIYYALSGIGAYCLSGNVKTKLSTKTLNYQKIKVAISKSHSNQMTSNFINFFKNSIQYPLGSSLKLINIACGLVDIYPRFGSTSIWDISAAHIILKESGGFVLDLKTNKELVYDSSSLINNYFFAISKSEYIDFFKPYLSRVLDF